MDILDFSSPNGSSMTDSAGSSDASVKYNKTIAAELCMYKLHTCTISHVFKHQNHVFYFFSREKKPEKTTENLARNASFSLVIFTLHASKSAILANNIRLASWPVIKTQKTWLVTT